MLMSDQARELYANATMEKISLISLIRTNEHERRDERRDDQIRLTQDMSDGVKVSPPVCSTLIWRQQEGTQKQ